MASESSAASWLQKVRAGDSQTQHTIWEQYFPELVTLARQRLAGTRRAVADEEDIALSVLQSFFSAAQENRFPDLRGHDSLWRLLSRMTQRKAVDWIRHLARQKRRVQGESACFGGMGSDEHVRAMDLALDPEPTPDLEAMLIDELRRLLGMLNEPMRLVATRKLDGWSNAEIAQELGCSLATVERRLKMIREIWNHHGKAGESSPKSDDSSSS